jgi:hypothetical protein
MPARKPARFRRWSVSQASGRLVYTDTFGAVVDCYNEHIADLLNRHRVVPTKRSGK